VGVRELRVPDDEFAAWVHPHLESMGRLAARLCGTAERDDVVQESLTRAWRKRDLFDPTRGSPRTWLLAIVADQARKSRRRARPAVASNGADRVADRVVGPVDADRVDLERALARLPARMRLAVDCMYFVGLTVAETAVVMDVSEGTVKSTLAKARAHLHARLEVSHD
jgi:RNA polymerase sigma factor (sigma-70 family)